MATPPATDNPMMVELEIPELLGLPPAGGCVGVDELAAGSEITTMLVTVCPPWFVVKKAEVTGGSEERDVVVVVGVFVGEVFAGVDEELCSVVDGTTDEEDCGVAEDVLVLLVDVGCGGDDEGSVELAGVGEVFCGRDTEIPWRGEMMFIAGESSNRS